MNILLEAMEAGCIILPIKVVQAYSSDTKKEGPFVQKYTTIPYDPEIVLSDPWLYVDEAIHNVDQFFDSPELALQAHIQKVKDGSPQAS